MTDITKYIADYLAVNIAADLLARSMNAKLADAKEESNKLREQLAESDQQIEWLSKEIAAYKREAREVSVGLLELRDVTTEALTLMRKRVDHDAAEIEKLRGYVARDAAEVEKWRERYHRHSVELAGARNVSTVLSKDNADLRDELDQRKRNNEYLRGRVAFLEKALNSKPGTMYFGSSGIVISGYSSTPKEIIDAVESMRVEHFHNDEDRWYTCPKTGRCANESMPTDMCTCGADKQNATVDMVLAYLRGEQR